MRDLTSINIEFKLERARQMISKELRKQLKLPITKDIVYYKRILGKEYNKFDVESIEIMSEYNNSGSYSLRISLTKSLMSELEQVDILSDFLIQMQKPNFIEEVNEIENEKL